MSRRKLMKQLPEGGNIVGIGSDVNNDFPAAGYNLSHAKVIALWWVGG